MIKLKFKFPQKNIFNQIKHKAMEKHFKLNENFITKYGIKLYQLELTKDCKFGKIGDLGGYCENENSLIGENAWIYPNAICFKSGVIWGGVIRGGEIWGGVIRGGEIWGGEIHGGVIWGGEIWGGVIRGGEIHGGVIRGGVISGGEIHGGVIRGGVISGGVIRGGVISGGVISGGEIIKSPLQFQGSKHFANVCKPNYLKIGCVEMTFKDWQKELKNHIVGNKNSYTEQEKMEYTMFVKIVLKFGNDCFKKDQNGKFIES